MLLEKKIIIFSRFNFSPAYIEKEKKKTKKPGESNETNE